MVAAEYGYGSNAWPAQVSYPLNSAQVTYAYDSAGTVTTNPTGSAVYEYDGQNRLVSYTPPVPSQHGAITYEYNNLGQKTSVTNGSQVVHYDYYANGWLKAVRDEYTYDGWGNLTDHTQYDGSVSQPYQYVGQLGYYTHVQDANLPLLQLGVRMYDPEVGRFGQEDVIQMPGWGRHLYCQDRPTGSRDPSGEHPVTELLYGDGQICVASSCYGDPCFPGGLRHVPDWNRWDETKALPVPPSPIRMWGVTVPRMRCTGTDGMYVPPGTQIVIGGAPQRPAGRDHLKIRDGWTCLVECRDHRIRVFCFPRAIPVAPWHPVWE